jgi:hypothetical protein
VTVPTATTGTMSNLQRAELLLTRAALDLAAGVDHDQAVAVLARVLRRYDPFTHPHGRLLVAACHARSPADKQAGSRPAEEKAVRGCSASASHQPKPRSRPGRNRPSGGPGPKPPAGPGWTGSPNATPRPRSRSWWAGGAVTGGRCRRSRWAAGSGGLVTPGRSSVACRWPAGWPSRAAGYVLGRGVRIRRGREAAAKPRNKGRWRQRHPWLGWGCRGWWWLWRALGVPG